MSDRIAAIALFGLALGAISAALIMVLFDYIIWLQTDRWTDLSLLQALYDAQLLKARWFLQHQWSWPLHDALERVPLSLGLAAVAPPLWWLGKAIARR